MSDSRCRLDRFGFGLRGRRPAGRAPHLRVQEFQALVQHFGIIGIRPAHQMFQLIQGLRQNLHLFRIDPRSRLVEPVEHILYPVPRISNLLQTQNHRRPLDRMHRTPDAPQHLTEFATDRKRRRHRTFQPVQRIADVVKVLLHLLGEGGQQLLIQLDACRRHPPQGPCQGIRMRRLILPRFA